MTYFHQFGAVTKQGCGFNCSPSCTGPFFSFFFFLYKASSQTTMSPKANRLNPKQVMTHTSDICWIRVIWPCTKFLLQPVSSRPRSWSNNRNLVRCRAIHQLRIMIVIWVDSAIQSTVLQKLFLLNANEPCNKFISVSWSVKPITGIVMPFYEVLWIVLERWLTPVVIKYLVWMLSYIFVSNPSFSVSGYI